MKKGFLLLCVCFCIATAEDAIISFNTIFLGSEGKFSFTYPVALPKQAALTELQNNFIKQKFGESFVGQDPATVLSLYKNQNKEVEFLSDIVSFPFPNIVQYVTSSYVFINGTAHGVSGINIGIYSITDGKKIELGSLFLKDWEKNIVKLIIKEFLLSQNLQVLGDYNYTQKESDFMPERARISESGLEFVFPPYQVAPYAAGEQSVFLSWNILKPYLNKKSLIYQKLKF